MTTHDLDDLARRLDAEISADEYPFDAFARAVWAAAILMSLGFWALIYVAVKAL